MPAKRTYVILNPASSGGVTGSRLDLYREEFTRHFGGGYSLHLTTGRLDATVAARRAAKDGYELIVAVGGDGTIQEVINGLILDGVLIDPEVRLGVIDAGTGSGFVQSLGLPSGLKEQIETLRCGRVHPLDLGSLEVSRGTGGRAHRFFCNECQVGIGAEVVRLVQKKYKRLGGTLGFGLGSIQAIFSHPNQTMVVDLDGVDAGPQELLGIMVGNGAYAAGGMHLAPGARQDDGHLNVVVIARLWIPGRLRAFSKIYRGDHVGIPSIDYTTATSISISSEEEVPISSDGEFLGTAPARIEILPHVLPVMVQEDRREDR